MMVEEVTIVKRRLDKARAAFKWDRELNMGTFAKDILGRLMN